MSLKRLLPLLAALCVVPPASARDFADQTPAGSLFYLEITDAPDLLRKHRDSPIGRALRSIDWMGFLDGFAELEALEEEDADGEDADDLSPAEMRKAFETFGERWEIFAGYLNGGMMISAGNFEAVVAVFKENQATRDAMYGEGWDEVEDDGEDPMERVTEFADRESELDRREFEAIAKQFRFMVEVRDGDAFLNQLKDWWEEDRQTFGGGDDEEEELVTREIDGLTVYAFTPVEDEDDEEEAPEEEPELMWTVKDGVWVVAFSEGALREALRHLDDPPSRSLAASNTFRDAVDYIGQRDVLFHFNPAQFDRLLRMGLEGMDMPPQTSLTPEKILDWLALDALLPYSIGTRMEDDGIATRVRLGFTRECALSRIFLDPSNTPAPTPAWVHRDFQQLSTVHWHPGEFWTRLEREITALAPEASAGLGMGRLLATGQIGFDPKLQFFDHLDGGITFVQEVDPEVMGRLLELQDDPAALMEFTQRHPTNGQKYLIGLGTRNPDAIRGTLNTLLSRMYPAGVPEPGEINGHPVHFPLAGMPGAEARRNLVAVTLLENDLLIAVGDPALLQKAIVASRDPAVRLWEDGTFQDLRDRMPPVATLLEYGSGDQQQAGLRMMVQALESVSEDVSMPDISALGDMIKQVIGVTVRTGLVFEGEGFIEFGRVEE